MQIEDYELKGKLTELVQSQEGIHTVDEWVSGHKHSIPLKIAAVQDKTPLCEDDVYGHHVFIQRFYKKDFPNPNKLPLEHVKTENIDLQEMTEDYLIQGIDALFYFYGDGQNYGFTGMDGNIEPQAFLKEEEDFFDLYFFFAYIGK